MTKHIVLLCLIAIGCAGARHNFAVAAVRIVDEQAQCYPIHHAVGPDSADSALCKMGDGAWLFMSLSAKDINPKLLAPAPKPAPAAPPPPAP